MIEYATIILVGIIAVAGAMLVLGTIAEAKRRHQDTGKITEE